MHILRIVLVAGFCASVLGCASQQEPLIIPASSFDQDDYKGKIVLLNFWATWCGACRYEIPALVQVRNSFDPEKVVIIGVSLDQQRPILEEFIEQYGINYTVVLDDKWELVQQYYRGDSVPMTFIIDQQGKVFKAHRGLPVDAAGQPKNPLGVYAEDIQTLLDRT